MNILWYTYMLLSRWRRKMTLNTHQLCSGIYLSSKCLCIENSFHCDAKILWLVNLTSLDLSESKYVWKIYLWTHFKESLRNPSLVTGQFSLSRPVPGCWALAPGGLVTVSNYGLSVICHWRVTNSFLVAHFGPFQFWNENYRTLEAWKCKHLSPKHQNAANR